MARVMTKHYPGLIDKEFSLQIFESLKNNIQWNEGVRSKHGFTRLAKALDIGDNELVDGILIEVLKTLQLNDKYCIFGVYLNYMQNGNNFIPNHSHKDMTQLVISLGAARTLKVGSKDYPLSSGDVIIFGSSTHGIAKEPNVTEGRISIATFMKPIGI